MSCYEILRDIIKDCILQKILEDEKDKRRSTLTSCEKIQTVNAKTLDHLTGREVLNSENLLYRKKA